MALNQATATNTGYGENKLLLVGEVTIKATVIEIVQTGATATEGATTRRIEYRKYDLNNIYEWGAFVEDSGNNFVEEKAASAMSAWVELKDPKTTAERKRQIFDTGMQFSQYPNTRRLASVYAENNSFYLVNQNQPSIWNYNYDDRCEKRDFETRVTPGTNRRDPGSPCWDVVVQDDVITGSAGDTKINFELSLLNNSFTEFDDYTRGYKSLFQEVGFKSGSSGTISPFTPKQFQFISQSLIVDQFENIIGGPIRAEEQTSKINGGTKVELVIYQGIQRRNKRTGAVTSGSGEVEVYRTVLEEIPGEIFIYKKLQRSSIQSTTLYNNTVGVWNGKGKLYNFYTSSIQTKIEKSYKLDVFSGSCDVSKMFSIYYGDFNGHGTVKLSDDRKQYGHSKSVYSMFSSLVGNSITKKLFFTDNSTSQSAYLKEQLSIINNNNLSTFINTNFSLGYDPTGYGYVNYIDGLDVVQMSGSDFYYKPGLAATSGPTLLTPTKTSEKIFAIQINPTLLKDTIDEGNFELCLARLSGLNVDDNSDKILQLIDSSRKYDIIIEGDSQDSNRFKSGFVGQSSYDLVSGSLVAGIYRNTSPEVYGKVYPGYGLIILDAEKLNTELNLGIVSQSNFDGQNPLKLFTSISGAASPTSLRSELFPFNARKVDANIVDSIQVLLDNKDFNYSTNPSYYSNRERSPFFRPPGQTTYANGKIYDGTLRFRQWFYDPITYITAIGLYNDDFELLAIGKLSKPIKKSFNDTLKLKINIRY